jgi:hypothetical protein
MSSAFTGHSWMAAPTWADTAYRPTGATMGTPGAFTPAGRVVPSKAQFGTGAGIAPSPATTWTSVANAVNLTDGKAWWNGSAWVVV